MDENSGEILPGVELPEINASPETIERRLNGINQEIQQRLSRGPKVRRGLFLRLTATAAVMLPLLLLPGSQAVAATQTETGKTPLIAPKPPERSSEAGQLLSLDELLVKESLSDQEVESVITQIFDLYCQSSFACPEPPGGETESWFLEGFSWSRDNNLSLHDLVTEPDYDGKNLSQTTIVISDQAKNPGLTVAVATMFHVLDKASRPNPTLMDEITPLLNIPNGEAPKAQFEPLWYDGLAVRLDIQDPRTPQIVLNSFTNQGFDITLRFMIIDEILKEIAARQGIANLNRTSDITGQYLDPENVTVIRSRLSVNNIVPQQLHQWYVKSDFPGLAKNFGFANESFADVFLWTLRVGIGQTEEVPPSEEVPPPPPPEENGPPPSQKVFPPPSQARFRLQLAPGPKLSMA